MLDKGALRKKFLAARRAMDLDLVQAHSEAICCRVIELPSFKEAHAVALYAPIRNEVDTELIFHEARRLSKKVLYPRVVAKELKFCEVTHLSELELGAWGILEPPEWSEVSIALADLVILPGVVFDREGRRLGYGKGYYDGALRDFGGFKLGLAFSCQIVDELSDHSNDIRLDCVMTESGPYPK